MCSLGGTSIAQCLTSRNPILRAGGGFGNYRRSSCQIRSMPRRGRASRKNVVMGLPSQHCLRTDPNLPSKSMISLAVDRSDDDTSAKIRPLCDVGPLPTRTRRTSQPCWWSLKGETAFSRSALQDLLLFSYCHVMNDPLQKIEYLLGKSPEDAARYFCPLSPLLSVETRSLSGSTLRSPSANLEFPTPWTRCRESP